MIDLILDAAGQKGTGKWTVVAACDLGVPLTLIGEAVFARCLSAQKEERVAASSILKGPSFSFDVHEESYVDAIEQALYASKIVSYAQGFALMDAMAGESKWEINKGGVALMWRGGCIIRSAFLGKIKDAFDQNPRLPNLMLDPYFRAEVERCQHGWRRAVGRGGRPRDSRAGDDLGVDLLRRLSQRAAAGEPASGAARLFRGTYLRARRPAPRAILSHQLDRPRRHDCLDDVQRLTARRCI